MSVDPARFGEALAARLADIAAAAARYDSFAFGDRPAAQGVAGEPPPEEPGAIARDLALAALRAAADPVAYAMLRRLAEGDTSLTELASLTGLPRLAVWERVNSLVAVGLVGRRHEDDTAGLSPAGLVVVELVEGAVAGATGPPSVTDT